MTGSALVLRGDALKLPLPDASVHLICTSPPYWSQRSYRDGDTHYPGQLGSESHPQEFLEALWAVMKECWRVLTPTGSCFVNLGDKRAGSGGHNNSGLGTGNLGDDRMRSSTLSGGKKRSLAAHKDGDVLRAVHATRRNAPDRYNQAAFGRPKSKMLLPHRFAIGCEDGLADPEGKGWVVRSDNVWQKLNCLSGGTVVYARIKGRPLAVRLHDLCRAYQPEDVQLWNGSRWTQALAWEPTGRHPDAVESYRAIRAARDAGREPVPAADLEIELRSGERIGCTREHRWPTQRGLVEASALLIGDVIDVAPLPSGEVFPAMLDDEEVGWFVGLYIAEGSRSERMIQISGHAREVDRFKRLRDLASSLHATCNVYTDGNKGNVTMAGRFLDAILDTYVGGRTAKDKHLRPKAWERSNTFLSAVLDGYLSGDGHHEAKADFWRLGFTTNDQWAADLRTIGARLGVSVRLRRGTVTGFDKQWPAWLGTLYTDPTRRKRPDSEVVAIRQSRARQFWDVAVADEPHLFSLASGVLTHNSLPESVTDRCRDSHEYLFHLTKEGRYFAAVDEVRENHSRDWSDSIGPNNQSVTGARDNGCLGRSSGTQSGLAGSVPNPLGKLPGSVWALPSEPLITPSHRVVRNGRTEQWFFSEREAMRHMRGVGIRYGRPSLRKEVPHFAAFPTELVRRVILGWSPSAICTACGEGRRPVVAKERVTRAVRTVESQAFAAEAAAEGRSGFSRDVTWMGSQEATITGYACSCTPYTDHADRKRGDGSKPDKAAQRVNSYDWQAWKERETRPQREYHLDGWTPPPTRPSVVLDIFGGTGTTVGVARALGRIGLSVDLSHDYSRLARYMIERSGRFSKVVTRTHRDNQGDLFGVPA